jgi:hypothetical protein
MAEDVQRISGTNAKAAARLCNFKTGKSFLLTGHQDYLDDEVRAVIRTMQKPFVDLFGYASRAGDGAFNMALSGQRMNAVKARISEYANQVEFRTLTPYGETQSGPNERNDDGYYRAVEVYVYAEKPPTPKPPKPKHFLRRFVFRSFSKDKLTTDRPSGGQPDIQKDAINDLLKLGVALAKGQLEGQFGPETSHRVEGILADHKVNKVIVDRKRTLDQFVGGDRVTETTNVTYQWGPPLRHVIVETKFEFVWNGKQHSSSHETVSLTRKQAETNSLTNPPDPKPGQ